MLENEKQKLLSKRSRRIIEGVNREINKRKKLKLYLFICLLLWSAAGAQWIAERIFKEPAALTEAFVNSNTIMNESMLEATAYYGNDYLTETDKADLVRFLAEGLGIQVNKDNITTWKYEDKEAFIFVKEAKYAETTIKCVTLDGSYSKSGKKEHYLFVRIIINADQNNDITVYQKKVKDLFINLNAEPVSNTLQFNGNFAGKLSVNELNSISNRMINQLGGTIVYENRMEELYTVYAYSKGIEDYVTVDGMKMNIQVAASYNEEKDQTKIYLATPIISGDW